MMNPIKKIMNDLNGFTSKNQKEEMSKKEWNEECVERENEWKWYMEDCDRRMRAEQFGSNYYEKKEDC